MESTCLILHCSMVKEVSVTVRRCLLLNNAAEGFALFPLRWLVDVPLQQSFPTAYALKIPIISASSYWKLFASEALYTVLIIMHKT